MCHPDGSQRYFYVAEHIYDINEKTYFVHDFVQGYPVELAKFDRLQTSDAQAEDDRGKKRMDCCCWIMIQMLTREQL